MKIYFAGSIRGGRDDQDIYAKIIRILQKHGEVLTEHVGRNISSQGEELKTDQDIFSRDLQWLEQADIIIAEVTTPSLGVGYEIAKAEQMGKHLLCLFRKQNKRRVSAMISGNPNLHVRMYKTIEEIGVILEKFFMTTRIDK